MSRYFTRSYRWIIVGYGSTCLDTTGVTYPEKIPLDFAKLLEGASRIEWIRSAGNIPTLTFTASGDVAGRIDRRIETSPAGGKWPAIKVRPALNSRMPDLFWPDLLRRGYEKEYENTLTRP